ncbi:hypothetical protein VQ056_16440 [Paenibacillus sp. JTLBN-2024]
MKKKGKKQPDRNGRRRYFVDNLNIHELEMIPKPKLDLMPKVQETHAQIKSVVAEAPPEPAIPVEPEAEEQQYEAEQQEVPAEPDAGAETLGISVLEPQETIEEWIAEKKLPESAKPFIYAEDLSDGSVVTSKIAFRAVDSSRLKPGAVDGEAIADYAVTHVHLADGAVTTSKIAAYSIIEDHVADGAFGGSKLRDQSIGGEKNPRWQHHLRQTAGSSDRIGKNRRRLDQNAPSRGACRLEPADPG